MKTIIKKDEWNRYETFKHYDSCTNPFIIISSKIDITNIYNYAKRHQLSMYASLGYLISITANEFDGFKLRKENEDFVLYENIIPNFTENINGENVYYFDVKLEDSISKYNEEFIKLREMYSKQETIFTSEPNEIWLSCAPWFSFNTLTPPYNHDLLIPQLIWDKFNKENAKVTTNLMVMIHHGFMDGYQIGMFYKKLEENIKNFKGDEN